MKRNWIVAGAAWAGIVALAWWLADQRIEICSYERACKLRATVTRDDILVWGVGVGLAALLLIFVGRAPPASERSAGSQSPRRTALLVSAMKVRVRAIRLRRWWLAPAAGAGVLIAVLGWNLWGGKGDQSKEGPWSDFQRSRQTPVVGHPYATYEITAPDGKTYSIDGPDGATEAQVRQQILAQFPAAMSNPFDAISRPVDADPYAAFSTPVAEKPARGPQNKPVNRPRPTAPHPQPGE